MGSDLRDEIAIAIAAMTALIREGFYTPSVPPDISEPRCHERLARMAAYDIAGAMLQTRADDVPRALGRTSQLN